MMDLRFNFLFLFVYSVCALEGANSVEYGTYPCASGGNSNGRIKLVGAGNCAEEGPSHLCYDKEAQITENNCAGEKGSGVICSDSDSNPYLCGLISRPHEPSSNSAGVYTDVNAFQNWIASVDEKCK